MREQQIYEKVVDYRPRYDPKGIDVTKTTEPKGIHEQEWQNGVEETSVIEVGAQAHPCYSLHDAQLEAAHQEARRAMPMALGAARHTSSVQTARDSNQLD
ncbi:hypothetical protein HAX54_048939 [Datura stramonium]|uniref:Uncharacterized protein n=1 Tax=Datura stramonium TaxID=4076 RepID=A0ABS8WNM8_DATST|nr:hypothetical protein [Datura stramonium]